MAKIKTFYIRFYSTEPYGRNQLALHGLLNTYIDSSGNILTPIIQIGDKAYRFIIQKNNINNHDNTISGYFATYRDEAITKGFKSSGKETLITLNPDEAIVEKTYFTLFYGPSSELLFFQNSQYGRINDLRAYLNKLFHQRKEDGGIAISEIGSNEFDISKILQQKPQYVEYRLAKPKKYNKDTMPSWEQEQFEMMEETGARSFSAKISTRASGGLNKSVVSKLLEEMKESEYIRKCRVKIEDIDTPIDLLADILKSEFTLSLSPNGTIDEGIIFYNIKNLKDKYSEILQGYV